MAPPTRPPLDDQAPGVIAKHARQVRGRVVQPPDDPNDPLPQDVHRFSAPTVICPSCKCEMLDEANICPGCGLAVDSIGPATVPWWVFALLPLVIIALILAMW